MNEIMAAVSSFFRDPPSSWGFLLLGSAYCFYLFIALFTHRRDRLKLTEQALSSRVDLLFRYSWKGVTLKISQKGKSNEEGPNGTR
jgi:hypothetical protein